MFTSAALQVVVVAGTFLVGFGSGWAVDSRRTGAKIAESRDAVVTAGNKQCKRV
jgi:hypothetical protein